MYQAGTFMSTANTNKRVIDYYEFPNGTVVKAVQGDQVYHCEGFESDEQMKEWSYRKVKGVTYFEESDLQAEQGEQGDAQTTN
jgi:hypothetical protein